MKGWRATGPDGVAHLFTHRRLAAPCGARQQEERFDYPPTARCAVCRESEEALSKRPKAS